MYWIAYVALGTAVGLILGYFLGHRQGYEEGWDGCAEVQRAAYQIRGQKAAATRRARVIE